MRRTRHLRAVRSLLRGCLAIPLLAVLLCAPTVAGPADRQSFRIVLDGTFGEFVMYCTLVDGNDQRGIRRREFLPHAYSFTAEAISCSVNLLEFRGRISATLYAGDRLVASAAQNAVRPVVKVRSDGPWGLARGVKSSVPIPPRTPPESPEQGGEREEQPVR